VDTLKPLPEQPAAERAWWENAVIYQIYPRSFQDSNGDGIGDLAGIRSRLDYLQRLGVDAIWLNPIYPSPQVDFGYDVSDHADVAPEFGTLRDFDALVSAARARDIRVIVDFVVNHTSDRHPMFVDARSDRNSPFRDWYVWRDPAPDGGPPNNWRGFEESAWTLDAATGQYYLHYFYRQQPDLNWRNPAVRAWMYDQMRFWLRRGVSGLRLDAIDWLVEDAFLRDNPPQEEVPLAVRRARGFIEGQTPVYNVDQPELFDIVREMRTALRDFGHDPLLLGEAWAPPDVLRRLYGARRDGLHTVFQFLFQSLTALDAGAFREVMREVDGELRDPDGPLPVVTVLGTHDVSRVLTRLAVPLEWRAAVARLLATLQLTQPGLACIYYGEELGMLDGRPERLGDLRDPKALAAWRRHAWRCGYEATPDLTLMELSRWAGAPDYGRDGCRLPMQWHDGPNAGFTSGKPWQAVHPDHARCNVAAQEAAPRSLLAFYRALIGLRRRHRSLREGALRLIGDDPHVLAYERVAGNERALVVLNMSSRERIFPLSGEGPSFVLSSRGPRPRPRHAIGLLPYEAAILVGEEA